MLALGGATDEASLAGWLLTSCCAAPFLTGHEPVQELVQVLVPVCGLGLLDLCFRSQVVKAERGHRDHVVQHLVFHIGGIKTQDRKWPAQIKMRSSGNSMLVCERKGTRRKARLSPRCAHWGVSLSFDSHYFIVWNFLWIKDTLANCN